MNQGTEVDFPSFYECWIKQLQEHLQRLVANSKQQQRELYYEPIAADITAHHRAYYTAKWAASQQDVLVFFSPPWLSPLETVHLWVTGWKPSMAFRIVESLSRTRAPLTSLAQLGEEQKKRVEKLRVKVKLEEEKVERDMERQQVSLADRKLVEFARVAGRRSGGGGGQAEDAAVKGLVAGLEKVAKQADLVRLKTLKGLLDLLSPKQGLDFLAVFSMVLLQLRRWGRERSSTAHGGPGP